MTEQQIHFDGIDTFNQWVNSLPFELPFKMLELLDFLAKNHMLYLGYYEHDVTSNYDLSTTWKFLGFDISFIRTEVSDTEYINGLLELEVFNNHGEFKVDGGYEYVVSPITVTYNKSDCFMSITFSVMSTYGDEPVFVAEYKFDHIGNYILELLYKTGEENV